MKNKTYISYILLLLSVTFQNLSAQCNPPMRETCDDSRDVTLCALDELNGYSCTNLSTTGSPCSPICSQGGVGNNTSWWTFMGNGGNSSITLNVGNCNLGLGLEFGIWGNCACGDEIICRSNPCTSPGTSKSVNFTTTKCKSYYLWVDGCNADICDFTINTSGGASPSPPTLGKINNKANMIIEPVCAGGCYYFFVDPSPEPCFVMYEWTWNGNILGYSEKGFETDVPNTEGDFTICVSARVYNPSSGITCTPGTPVCATVKIRKILTERTGIPRTLCWEQTTGTGFKWHSKYIRASGMYRQTFSEANCCNYDSIVEFTVLNPPVAQSVYYITCDNKPYIDHLGRKHLPCLNHKNVLLQKSTDLFRCDSSIELTAVNVDFEPTWSTKCSGGMVELIPNVKILKPCSAGETYEFDYKWFKKSNPAIVLGNDERLFVNSVAEDYCLQVTVITELETEIAVCTRTFCEAFDESSLTPYCLFSLAGHKVYCFDPIASYRIDSLFSQNVNYYSWSINGGTITSNPDSSAIEVKWSFNPQDTGKICASYNTDCGTSCEKCLTVYYTNQIAGDDFEKRGLSAYLNAKAHPNGMWRLISGPHQVRIEDPTDPNTKITAFNYGYYCFEWSINDPNCVMKDTLCVNLHSFKKASPEYPKDLFSERAGTISNHDQSTQIIFTPNLIENNGESFVTKDGDESGILKYKWIDIYGRLIAHDELPIETGIQRMNIHSPDKGGMYFLVIEMHGKNYVKKICIME